ncbi:PorH family porin [Corynebacterium choanae]|uniref:Uncharacterized protein n=1 Tax=Corynebacterium choanae TaxID=1862358 RepID=A0A3G6J4S4_9CORY|nr:PorH family porin [Corynebacterium choanae]AZA12733.1 hypothetical protein CCHOA_01525 [Corynebacterium choanae]
MDLSLIKTQLGQFKTFVEATGGLLENLPTVLYDIYGLFSGKLSLFGNSADYNQSVLDFGKEIAESKAK